MRQTRCFDARTSVRFWTKVAIALAGVAVVSDLMDAHRQRHGVQRTTSLMLVAEICALPCARAPGGGRGGCRPTTSHGNGGGAG